MENLDIELTDEDAVEQTIEMLKSVKFDDSVKTVKVTVSGVGNSKSKPREKQADSISDASRAIRPNTSHHTIVHTIAKLTEDDGTATTRKIINAIDNYAEGTIRPSLTELVERGLVEREDIGDENTHYEYKLTEKAEETLDEFGKPE